MAMPFPLDLRREHRSTYPPDGGARSCRSGEAWVESCFSEHHNSPSDKARNTASVRVLTASFKKICLTCDFTVSGEISRLRVGGMNHGLAAGLNIPCRRAFSAEQRTWNVAKQA